MSSLKKLYIYTPVTVGELADIGMAYDVTMQPLGSRPAVSERAQTKLEVVRDLVELDSIRAELGQYRSNVAKQLVNRLWRKLKLDKGHLDHLPQKWREYRVGHAKH